MPRPKKREHVFRLSPGKAAGLGLGSSLDVEARLRWGHLSQKEIDAKLRALPPEELRKRLLEETDILQAGHADYARELMGLNAAESSHDAHRLAEIAVTLAEETHGLLLLLNRFPDVKLEDTWFASERHRQDAENIGVYAKGLREADKAWREWERVTGKPPRVYDKRKYHKEMLSILSKWIFLAEKIFGAIGLPYNRGPAFDKLRQALKEKQVYHAAALARLPGKK